MTIYWWVLLAGIAACFVGCGTRIAYALYKDHGRKKHFAIAIVVIISIVVAILLEVLFYYNHIEEGRRAFHTLESNLTGGLNRTVRVYDVEGELIVEYTGRFDVDHDESRILFDDENGDRHVIYYSVATVVIDEGEE